MKRHFYMGLMMTLAAGAALSSCRQKTASIPALDLADLDTAVAAGADFYRYATGGWQKNNPLKPEYSRYGSFDVLAENNEIKLNTLFEDLSTRKTVPGTEARKIADLYKMGLDSTRRNSEGAAPVLSYVRELESVSDAGSFFAAQARLEMYGVSGIYGLYVSDDMMDSKSNVLYIGESGLALGNRDFYLLPEHEAIRKGYRDFLEKIFSLAGYEDAPTRADNAFVVQMKIAVPHWSMVQKRDVIAQYNPMSFKELFEAYPNLCLENAFEIAGIPEQKKIILEQPSYFKAINEMVPSLDPVQLRHYLQAQVLSDACNYLSDDFYAASFDFFSKQLSGIQEPKPRWKRAMAVPNMTLGEAVGKLYVEKYFSEKDKERMLTIVRNIQKSLSQHIDSLDWMSDSTKLKAQEKLAAFTVKIGYPDVWKDYSTLNVDPGESYYENIRNVSLWYSQDNLSQLGEPVDKNKWFMSPQTVNAYYNPTSNEICFPAGILQPPFYNGDADDAVNYGAIGVVISHEMTHGFDDQGRLFDKDGNMNNWWTDQDSEAFAKKTRLLVDQFNAVEVLPGVFANGAASLGENIADQGGLRIAYTALQNSFGGVHPQDRDGFTAEQRFYLAYAKVWAQNITQEEMRKRVLTDVHSLGVHRVNVTLRNIDTFFEAFSIGEGDPMYRPVGDRVIIW